MAPKLHLSRRIIHAGWFHIKFFEPDYLAVGKFFIHCRRIVGGYVH